MNSEKNKGQIRFTLRHKPTHFMTQWEQGKKTVADAVQKTAAYSVTLPERLVFSMVSVASGVFDAVSEVLLPPWMKKSTSYRVTLGMMHKFINQNIVGLQGHSQPETPPASLEGYLQRKTAGTVLEAAGLAIFRFSPLWLFAIISDAAGGSKVYMEYLATHLKQNGLVPENASTQQISELLEAIQLASDQTASIVDMPPLSVADAGKTAQEILGSYAMTGKRAATLLPDVEDLWSTLLSLSEKGIPLEKIAGIMTLDAAKNAAWSTANATAEVLDAHIIKSYRDTLKSLETEGAAHYISRKMQPYLVASLHHFSPNKVTWTEKGLTQVQELSKRLQSKLSQNKKTEKSR